MNYKSMCLTELVWRAKRGESGAMDIIMNKYSPLIRSRSKTGNTFNEDCRQYIALRALEKIIDFQQKEVSCFGTACLFSYRGDKNPIEP